MIFSLFFVFLSAVRVCRRNPFNLPVYLSRASIKGKVPRLWRSPYSLQSAKAPKKKDIYLVCFFLSFCLQQTGRKISRQQRRKERKKTLSSSSPDAYNIWLQCSFFLSPTNLIIFVDNNEMKCIIR